MSGTQLIAASDSSLPGRLRLRGRLLVGQSDGAVAVANSILVGVIHESLGRTEIEAIYGARYGIVGALREDLCDLGRESPATIEGLRHTPAAALGMSRYRLMPKDYDRLLQVFRAHNIRYFCFIGGNEAMDTARRVDALARDVGYELRVIGAPGTADNSLTHTDHCPGYGSAARSVALMLRDTGLDTIGVAHSTPVKIVEIMGRRTGWLTAATALAKEGRTEAAPDLIYVPERPFSLENFLADVRQTYQERGRCVVALSEGIRDEQGNRIGVPGGSTDASGSSRFGAGVYLSQMVNDELQLECRFEKPETIQRCMMACASPVDLSEAYTVGRMAVHYMVEGASGKMVTLVRATGPAYYCVTGQVDLEVVTAAERVLPDDYLDRRGHPTQAFSDYALPLIGGPLPPYTRLAGHRVPHRLGD